MTLQEFLRALRHAWWIVVACLIAGALGGVAVALLQTPKYTAVSTLFIATTTPSQGPEGRLTDNMFVQARATTYAALASTSTVLEAAAASLGGVSIRDLQTSITSDARENTNLVDITSVAPSPERSADEANAVALALARTVSELESAGTPGESQVILRVVQPAFPPLAPTSPKLQSTVLVGVIVGLASGVAGTVLAQILSGRLRSPRDVAAVAGLVPTSIPEARGRRGGASPERRREAYRSLRTKLRHEMGSRGCVVVAPVAPGASARPLAEELARAFGEIGTSVLLIDADRRAVRGRASRRDARHGMSVPEHGLAEVLAGQVSLQDAVVAGDEVNLSRLPAGGFADNTSQLLSGEAMKRVIDVAVREFDCVLVVSPPVLERSEAAVLAARAQACVLYMTARATRRSDLLFALERIFAVGVMSVDLVLDNVSRHDMQPALARYAPTPQLARWDADAVPERAVPAGSLLGSD